MLKMLRELQFAAVIASTRYHWGFFFLDTFKNRWLSKSSENNHFCFEFVF